MQGQPPGSKLDTREVFILGLVEETPDISLAEIAERLMVDAPPQPFPRSPEVFAEAFPKLIRRAALQAIARSGRKCGLFGDQTPFIEKVLTSEYDRYDAVGLRHDARFSSPEITDGALEVDDRLVHLFMEMLPTKTP